MKAFSLAAIPFLLLGVSASALAQGPGQIELKIEPSNRTLTINADDTVMVDPEIAILHIGFETSVTDAKSAYAEGGRTSNAIISALKQAGIPETSIRSEFQQIEPVGTKTHKFKLVQNWTVKTPPERVAEILEVAVTAGATDSGNIEWTVKDEKALETEALKKAAARAKEQAAELAQAMGVRLGALVYTTNQMGGGVRPMVFANNSVAFKANLAEAQPLSIEPRKVIRSATVYAVYSIE